MKQTQRAGDNTNNYQAESITITGVSYTEAKEIALDVFRANALELSHIARRTAEERVEEITEKIFEKLMQRAPKAIQAVTDPGIQRAIFRVQEEYACSGEETLGDVLVDMLVDRARSQEADLQQIALNEAIKTAPKLATHHFTVLATLLLVGRTQFSGIRTLPQLHAKLNTVVAPATEGLRVTEGDLRHLQYAGCLSIDTLEKPFSHIFSVTYPALFTKGFTRDEINEPHKNIGLPAIMPCLRDGARFQVSAMNKDVLNKSMIPEQGLEEHADELSRLMDLNLMSAEEIQEEISALHPNLRNLANVWSSSRMPNCELTSVGIVVAHANARRILGEEFTAGLDVWLN
ncbi:LPO_1073/Vpar_1526 family protein [Streptomyces rubiginosohelvolus]|uniref:LPO_1073/Vpar_1526 family protein n=1 Tax=Streptomyces rubiginosohelvolus TaxID=67362 RepID=A0ABW6F8Q7_9ACTN